jgi:hypothetical protein
MTAEENLMDDFKSAVRKKDREIRKLLEEISRRRQRAEGQRGESVELSPIASRFFDWSKGH